MYFSPGSENEKTRYSSEFHIELINKRASLSRISKQVRQGMSTIVFELYSPNKVEESPDDNAQGFEREQKENLNARELSLMIASRREGKDCGLFVTLVL